MRKLILKMSMSLDGFVAAPDGSPGGLFQDSDEQSKAWTLETVWNASLHLMGSRTFHEMVAFWPTSTDAFAPPMNRIPKAVFTHRGHAVLEGLDTPAGLERAARVGGNDAPTTLQPGAESWTHPYVADGGLEEEIVRLKAEAGKPMIAHGGADFARSLVASDLVDEYHLAVHPVILGRGLPIFSDLAQARRLKRMDVKTFPGGCVALIYRPA
ncbi:dihydrofolate reductase family protein [Phenylobacterium sp.]|jgi:dihydrofolate reductase|uniref:dihydrofolate reductase family protein n=1 Tax=Phenylobacterium sp. TaxID=1871053 RepID=UPI002F429EEE